MRSLLPILLVILFSCVHADDAYDPEYDDNAGLTLQLLGQEFVSNFKVMHYQYDEEKGQWIRNFASVEPFSRNSLVNNFTYSFNRTVDIGNLLVNVTLMNETVVERADYEKLFEFIPTNFTLGVVSKEIHPPETANKFPNLTYKYKLFCKNEFKGPKCQDKCFAKSPRKCDDKGRHVCEKGFGGKNCDMKFTDENCHCKNNGYCYSAIEIIDGKEGEDRTLCECMQWNSGESCEIGQKLPDTDRTERYDEFLAAIAKSKTETIEVDQNPLGVDSEERKNKEDQISKVDPNPLDAGSEKDKNNAENNNTTLSETDKDNNETITAPNPEIDGNGNETITAPDTKTDGNGNETITAPDTKTDENDKEKITAPHPEPRYSNAVSNFFFWVTILLPVILIVL